MIVLDERTKSSSDKEQQRQRTVHDSAVTFLHTKGSCQEMSRQEQLVRD